MSHTPGPWVRDTNVIVDHKIAPTFAIGNFYSEPDHSVAVANAHLISAAPDLLAALMEVVAFIEAAADGKKGGFMVGDMATAHELGPWRMRTRNAIAKAEGK